MLWTNIPVARPLPQAVSVRTHGSVYSIKHDLDFIAIYGFYFKRSNLKTASRHESELIDRSVCNSRVTGCRAQNCS